MLNLSSCKGWKLCLILLVCYNFFNIIILPDEFCKILRYAMFTYFGASSYLQISQSIHSPFKKCINMFLILLLVSMLMAQLFWNQSIPTTFVSSYGYFCFFLYFYLYKEKYTTTDIESGFYYASIVFLGLFLISHLVYPMRLVRGFGEIQGIVDTSRGMARIRLTLMGAAPIYFLFFYYIRQMQEKYTIKLAIVLMLLFAVIVMQLGRLSIILSFFLGVFLYLKNIKLRTKIIATIACFGILYLLITYVPVINNMINLTQEQQTEGGDYVRSMAYDFYLHNVSPNIFTDIFGNGQYSLGKSPLGDYVDMYGRSWGLIPADVGYAYIFINFGYMGWLFWFMLLCFVMKAKIPERYLYVKYYVLFLYLSNFAGNTLLGGIHLLVISIYLIDQVKIIRCKKIKVLHVVHNFLKGGIEGFLYYLCKKQIEDKSLDVHILCCCDENAVVNKRMLELGIPIHYINIKPFDLRMDKYIRVCRLSDGFDIVHVHTFQPILCYSFMFTRAKILFTMHGAGSVRREKNIKSKTKIFMLRFFLNNIASGVAHNSFFTQKYWNEHGITKCPLNKVVYNGVFFNRSYNTSYVYTENPILRGKKIIGTTCRMIPWKRVDVLVNAYIKALPKLPEDWDLLVVGEGPELSSLKKLVGDDFKICNRIHFVGYKSNITDYQSLMDVCVFPSAEEPFGLVAVECLHLGKPVFVMQDGGGLVEIINGVSPEFVAESQEDLSNKLIKYSMGEIIHDPNKAMQYANKFTIERTEREYYGTYTELIK